MSQTADGSVSAMESRDHDGTGAGVMLDADAIELALHNGGYPARKPTQRSTRLTEIDVWAEDPNTRGISTVLTGTGLVPFRANRRSGHRFWMALDTNGWVKVDAKLRGGESPASFLRDLIWLVTRSRGLVVAVVGSDGAGKSTVIDCVAHTMPIDVATAYLGTKRRSSSADPANGQEAGSPPPAANWRSYAGLPRWMVRTLAALWTIEKTARKGAVVLCDRHPIEAGRLGDEPTVVKLAKRVVVRMLTPAPDLVVLLHAPGEVLFARKGEHTPEYLDKMTAIWTEFVAARQGLMIDVDRSPESVCHDLQSEIWRCLLPKRVE